MVGTRRHWIAAALLAAFFCLVPAYTSAEEPTVSRTIFFSKPEIDQIRTKFLQAREMPATASDGWSRSNVNPMDVLAVFSPLRLKEAYALVGYRLVLLGNGKGVVYAVPKGRAVPIPEDAWEEPRPPGALEDVMDAIDGDRSPWSYLCASILQREFQEFGAMWHGQNWSTHMILDSDPWQLGREAMVDEFSQMPVGNPGTWKWAEPKPKEWRPRVRIEEDAVEVTFYTHSCLGRQAIYRHTDVFRPGSYRFSTKSTVIAQGPGQMYF